MREEAYYFAPQGQTKIMNEGWASYWHSTIMTTRALKDHEIIDYADHHSGTMATQPGQLNPYKLGIELFRDIEDRWNKGRFGKEWDECDDLRARRAWDKKLGAGREKIFEVRKHYNDVTFIDEFLTPEFAIEQKLFVFNFNDKKQHLGDRDPRVQEGEEQAAPVSSPTSASRSSRSSTRNYENRGELVLVAQARRRRPQARLRQGDAQEPPARVEAPGRHRHQGRGQERAHAPRRHHFHREEGRLVGACDAMRSPLHDLVMLDSRLASVSVHSVSLVIPASHFQHLPRKLGCALHRHVSWLDLSADRPGCELEFELDGEKARLTHLSVHDDPQGRFMRDVAALVVAYHGDLEATLEWNPARDEPPLLIAHGETSHPLLDQRRAEPLPPDLALDVSLPQVERWLEAARRAWREYRTLKGSTDHGQTGQTGQTGQAGQADRQERNQEQNRRRS